MRMLDFLFLNKRWLLAGGLISLSSSYGQTFFISIFAGEIMAEFDLSDGQWGGYYSAGTTASAIVMLWGGILSDRFRAGTLAAIVLVGLAIACLFMANLLSGLLQDDSGIDGLSTLAVVLSLTVVAGLAALIPARRALKVDPMVALRWD